ncbi:MAG: peptidylprolyl isomerase [Candidatus Aminicenantes bacterium]|nr:peptidylprolyl isomerase [Candidatus Aminicenantes bacterium]
MRRSLAANKIEKHASSTLKIIAGLAFVILVPLGVRSCLLSEGNWVTCRLRTVAGEIQFRLYPDRAPLTVANFLRYVEAGLYNDSTFFRVVTPDNQPNNKVKIEVIQGGDVAEAKCFPPVVHETTAQTGLKHRDGTVSMARDVPGTASSSFFICIGRQPELDFGGRRNPDGQGFAAFGRVVKGMDVVRRIQRMECEGQYLKKPVLITSLIRLLKPSELPGNAGTKAWRGTGIGVIREAVKAGFERMTFFYYLTLFLILALAGWLGWRGFIRQRWARREAPVWEGSSWAAGRETRPWLRALTLVVFLVLASLFGIMLIGM